MSFVHICVDMQIGELEKLPLLTRPVFKKRVWSLVQDLAAKNIPTIFVLYSGGGDICLPSFDEGVAFVGDMPRQTQNILEHHPHLQSVFSLSPRSLICCKSTPSVGADSLICDYLKRRGFSTAILSGMVEGTASNGPDWWKSSCVSVAARDLAAQNFDVVIAAEATQRSFRLNGKYYSLEQRRRDHAPLGARIEPIADLIANLPPQRIRMPLQSPFRSPLVLA